MNIILLYIRTDDTWMVSVKGNCTYLVHASNQFVSFTFLAGGGHFDHYQQGVFKTGRKCKKILTLTWQIWITTLTSPIYQGRQSTYVSACFCYRRHGAVCRLCWLNFFAVLGLIQQQQPCFNDEFEIDSNLTFLVMEIRHIKNIQWYITKCRWDFKWLQY